MDEIIKKDGIEQYFVENVLNPIFKDAYSNENIPRVLGSATHGFQNLEAVPAADMQSPLEVKNSTLESFSDLKAGDKVGGKKLYEVTKAMLKKLSNIMKFDTNWYHQYNGSFARVGTLSGKAIMKEDLPASSKQAYYGASNTARRGLTRSTDVGSFLSPAAREKASEKIEDNEKALEEEILETHNKDFVDDAAIKLNDVKTFFSEIQGLWKKWYDQASVKYTLYTCHSNCHGNCHGSRGRR